MSQYIIPFNKPFLVGKELNYIAQTVLNGQTSGDGAYSKMCQQLMEKTFDANHILMTHSCTAALEMSALLCDIAPGDEVIVPSFAFVTTANAFHMRGAKLKFADVRADTLNLDESGLQELITPRTKAIVPIHYAGVGCEMDEIMSIARENNIFVIEDAAQAVNAKYNGKYLGTIGDLGTYSFHETKNFTCGEGGALVINNEELFERAEIIREKGTDRSQFFRGEVDKYTWKDLGSSYLPSDILSAFLYAQLEQMQEITETRRKIYEQYDALLAPLAEAGLLTLPSIPPGDDSNFHMYYILLENEKIRSELIEFLKSKGILAIFHYLLLHLSPMGLAMGNSKGMLPVTESISDRVLRLPFYYDLKPEEQQQVTNSIAEFLS